MANTTPTQYMSLPNPNPGIDPGPDYADNIFSSFVVVDQHNHSAGSGVQITPAGININTDLPFNSNNAISLRTVRFQAQSLIPASSPDLLCLFASGVDLYYNDGNGNQVRITQGGSVSGSSGTITGLPSGTASASFVAGTGTFVWEQATSTGANMDAATYILRYPGSYPTPSGNFIALEAPASLSTGYAFVLPNNTPANPQSALVSDTSGNLSYLDPDDIGMAMTSAGANAVANSRTRSVGQVVGAGGVAISPSTGTFSTTVTVNDIVDVTLVTTGRPVVICLMPDNSGNKSFVSTDQLNTCFFRIERDATTIAAFTMGLSTAGITTFVPCGAVSTVDFPPAGSHFYQIDAVTSGGKSMDIFWSNLVAYEL